MILAKEATRVEMQNDAANVVDLVEGRRYEIYPGQPRYSQAEFQSYRLRLENDAEAKFESAEVEALPTAKLWASRADPVVASELGWRAERGIDEMCADAWRWQSANPEGYPAA